MLGGRPGGHRPGDPGAPRPVRHRRAGRPRRDGGRLRARAPGPPVEPVTAAPVRASDRRGRGSVGIGERGRTLAGGRRPATPAQPVKAAPCPVHPLRGPTRRSRTPPSPSWTGGCACSRPSRSTATSRASGTCSATRTCRRCSPTRPPSPRTPARSCRTRRTCGCSRGATSSTWTPRATARYGRWSTRRSPRGWSPASSRGSPRSRPRLLDDVRDRESFDLVDALAYPLPVTVIAELLGVPAQDLPLFRRWADGRCSRCSPRTPACCRPRTGRRQSRRSCGR